MVTNGDRKTNSFGKLVRQKVGLFSSWFSARGARSGWRPMVVVRLSPSKMRADFLHRLNLSKDGSAPALLPLPPACL